jgi:hypothetical protein
VPLKAGVGYIALISNESFVKYVIWDIDIVYPIKKDNLGVIPLANARCKNASDIRTR